jgi:hypothetical protein
MTPLPAAPFGFLSAKQAPSGRNSKNAAADDPLWNSHVQIQDPSPHKILFEGKAFPLEPFRIRIRPKSEQNRISGTVQKTDFLSDSPAEGNTSLPNQLRRFFNAEEVVFQPFWKSWNVEGNLDDGSPGL